MVPHPPTRPVAAFTPRATPPGYSHDLAVRAITSYYNFLQKLYLPPDTVMYPPPTGWAQITPKTMKDFNKNETVVKLMKHIPYINRCLKGERLCIARKTWPIQYTDERVRGYAASESDRWLVQPEFYMDPPPHVLCLANGFQDAYYVLIDTERGVAIWGGYGSNVMGPADNRGFELVPDYIDEWGIDMWMNNSTYCVDEFFEIWKQKFREMGWMPHPDGPDDVWETWDKDGDDNRALRKIMLDAGWSGDGTGGGWERERAEKAMQEREWRTY